MAIGVSHSAQLMIEWNNKGFVRISVSSYMFLKQCGSSIEQKMFIHRKKLLVIETAIDTCTMFNFASNITVCDNRFSFFRKIERKTGIECETEWWREKNHIETGKIEDGAEAEEWIQSQVDKEGNWLNHHLRRIYCYHA